ncbi:hypothetical protein GCM10027416_11700 [Okibacterium endophyticum]
MSGAQKPVQRAGQMTDDEYDLSFEDSLAPELVRLKNWLPSAMPTDGQPYATTRAQRAAPVVRRRVYPGAIDSRRSEF